MTPANDDTGGTVSAFDEQLGVLRRRVVDPILNAPPGTVVTITAPAGYGKSTVIDQLRRLVANTAFVPIGRQHDGPSFVADFLAAIGERRERGDARDAVADIDSDHFIEMAVELIEADIGPDLVIIDDLHLSEDPSIVEAIARIAWLLRTKRLLVASRRRPAIGSSRLKVRRRLLELVDSDLAMDESEARVLLERMAPMAALADAADDIERLHGWPAGLVLLGHALGQRSDTTARLALDSDLDEFLRDEVLATLSAPERVLLLELAVMTAFNPDVLAEVTGRADAAATLDLLLQKRLFIEGHRSRTRWLHFHEVFGALLRREAADLGEPRIRELQSNTVRVLLRAGERQLAAELLSTMTDPVEVTRLLWIDMELMWSRPLHRLATSSIGALPMADVPRTERTLEIVLMTAVSHGDIARGAAALAQLEQLRPWDDPAASPWALLLEGLLADEMWDNERATVVRKLALERATTQPVMWRRSTLSFAASANLAHNLLLADRLDQCREECANALRFADELGLTMTPHASSITATSGIAALAMGDVAAAQLACDEAAEHQAGSSTLHGRAHLATLRIQLASHDGDQDRATTIGREAVADPDFNPTSTSGALTLLALGGSERRHDNDAARRRVAHVQRLLRGTTGCELLQRLVVESGYGDVAPSARGNADLAAISSLELTDRERSIVRMLRSQLTLREIGSELSVSVNTVKTHTQAIYRKLHVSSRGEAIELLNRAGRTHAR